MAVLPSRRVLTVLARGAATAWLVAVGLADGAARAEDDVAFASITAGRLFVRGRTDAPHRRVVLDDRYETTSDDSGAYQFELIYHPPSCIVGARIGDAVHRAVVSNCGQQGPKGDPGDAAAGNGRQPVPRETPAPAVSQESAAAPVATLPVTPAPIETSGTGPAADPADAPAATPRVTPERRPVPLPPPRPDIGPKQR